MSELMEPSTIALSATTKAQKTHWELKLYFFILGSVVVLPFNFLMDTLPSLRDTLQFDTAAGITRVSPVTLTTTFHFSMVLGLVIFLMFPFKHPICPQIALAAFILVINTSTITQVYLKVYFNLIYSLQLVALAILGSVGSNKVLSLSATLESAIPGLCTAAQAGLGLSGIVIFGVWELVTQVIFAHRGEYYRAKWSTLTIGFVITGMVLLNMLAYHKIITHKAVRANPQYIGSRPTRALSRPEAELANMVTQDFQSESVPVALPSREASKDTSFMRRLEMTETQSISSDAAHVRKSFMREASFLIANSVVSNNFPIGEPTVIDTKEPYFTWRVFLHTSMHFIHVFITCFITCALFPNLTPLQWLDLNTAQSDICMGMYQIGTFLGRCLPLFYDKVNRIPRFLIIILVWGRFIFFALYFAFDFSYGLKILYILILSASNGYLCSIETFAAACDACSLGSQAQVKAANLCTIALTSGVFLGSALAIFLVRL